MTTSIPTVGTRQALIQTVVVAGIGMAICYLATHQLRALGDNHLKIRWLGISAAAGGLVGMGIWALQRVESRKWTLCTGYLYTGHRDQELWAVRFAVHCVTGEVAGLDSLGKKRLTSACTLLVSPIIIGFKLICDLLQFVGSLLASPFSADARQELGRSVVRLARDIPHAVRLPLYSLMAVFCPLSGQSMVAASVRRANLINELDDFNQLALCSGPQYVARVIQTTPLCNQPIAYVRDDSGKIKPISEMIRGSFMTTSAEEIIKAMGPNCGLDLAALPQGRPDADFMVGKAVELMGDAGQLQVHYNALARQFSPFSQPVLPGEE